MDSGGVTVSIVRFKGRGELASEREKVRSYSSHSRPQADWRQGMATSPSGRSGSYIEYEVQFDPTAGGALNTAIWWDDGTTSHDTATALILQTPSTSDPQNALDRLRSAWNDHGYSRS
jgi:hypothetical protein